MNPIKLALSAALIAASSAAIAADPSAQTRQQRMDDALHNYRTHQASKASTGTAERSAIYGTSGTTSTSAKNKHASSAGTGNITQDAKHFGVAVSDAAKATGHSIAESARKAGKAVSSTTKKATHAATK